MDEIQVYRFASQQPCIDASSKLLQWMQERNYQGWDPFDIQVPAVIAKLPKLPKIQGIWTYFGYYFPKTARRIANCPQLILPKTVALAARTAIRLWCVTRDDRYRVHARACLNWLKENPSRGFEIPCWGYPFDWNSSVYVPANTPNIVVSSQVYRAFLEAFDAWHEPADYIMSLNAIRFIDELLPRNELANDSICFGYTLMDKSYCHNANLMAVDLLVELGVREQREDWIQLGMRGARYTIERQEPDGAFDYFGAEQPGWKPQFRADHFHTGYVLRSLEIIRKSHSTPQIEHAFQTGLQFYLNKLCTTSGRPLDWSTKPWPVDIHSCSEAIIIPSVLRDEIPDWRARLDRTVQWVDRNFKTKVGTFYPIRQQWGHVTPIEYMRWAQAWMAFAFANAAVALQAERESKNRR